MFQIYVDKYNSENISAKLRLKIWSPKRKF